jgi:hypothetical protein
LLLNSSHIFTPEKILRGIFSGLAVGIVGRIKELVLA